jgi:predicted nucleotidyltransferase
VSERLRAIPPDFDPEPLAAIDRRLREIREEHGVAIGLAIESGSRAWGFPSPDSDYDCRFIFVRARDDYLSPWQKRDVIETPIEDDLDIAGWDLAKALKLMLKGNAVAIEWLMSPIVYDGDSRFAEALAQLARRHADRKAIARHYLHLGRRQRSTYFADGKDVQLKKLFYALRPAAALRWLRLHPEAAVAPMHFPTLMLQCDAPADVRELTDLLIAKKAVTRELGSAPLPAPIERFVDEEFAIADETLPPRSVRLSPEGKAAAEILFREWTERLSS